MKLSLLNEEVVNFAILQGYVVKDLLNNPRVQGFFAANNNSASSMAIMSAIGTAGMAEARKIIEAHGRKLSEMLYDVPDIHVEYSRTPNPKHIEAMRGSEVYRLIYDLLLSYFK